MSAAPPLDNTDRQSPLWDKAGPSRQSHAARLSPGLKGPSTPVRGLSRNLADSRPCKGLRCRPACISREKPLTLTDSLPLEKNFLEGPAFVSSSLVNLMG